MVVLKDSLDKEVIKAQYDELWNDLLITDEKRVGKTLEKIRFNLLPKNEKWKILSKPFRTHLIWIIPLSALIVAILLYVIFIWVALLVE